MPAELQKKHLYSEQIENRGGKIDIVENPKGYPRGVKMWIVDLGNNTSKISLPEYNYREDSHHESIATHIANGEAAAFFGVGLYGLGALIHDPRVPKYKDSYQVFFKAKSGRSELDRLPLLTLPKNLLEYMDITKVHPEFQRYFKTREAREAFWEIAIAIHVLGPLKDNPRIHEMFATPPDLWPKKNVPSDQWRDFTTVSLCSWYDRDLGNITDIVERKNPDSALAISSLNQHGKDPAFENMGLKSFIESFIIETGGIFVPFQIIVSDPIGESVGVRSSFAQLQVPSVDDKPEWRVYRKGPEDLDVLMERLAERFGVRHSYRMVEGVRLAARGHPEDANLQNRMDLVQRLVQEDYDRRHPQSESVFSKFSRKLVDIVK